MPFMLMANTTLDDVDMLPLLRLIAFVVLIAAIFFSHAMPLLHFRAATADDIASMPLMPPPLLCRQFFHFAMLVFSSAT